MRVRIRKADDDDKKTVYRLTEIEPQFVSLVTAGANRQKKFQVVKADDEADKVVPGALPTPRVPSQTCPYCGGKLPMPKPDACPHCKRPLLIAEDKAEKTVPAADASDEDKRKAQDARSKQYGIEALESGANLSYPAGDPTTEVMYGDPVNLKYPFGKDDNEPDLGRVRNALARFKQAADTYKQESSRRVVFTRIVERALEEGVEVGFDPQDPIDALLPQGIKDRLSEKANKDPAGAHDGSAKGEGHVDDLAWLDAAGAKVGELLERVALESPGDIVASTRKSKADPIDKAHVDEPRSAPAVKQLAEKASKLESEIQVAKAANDTLVKERDAAASENVALKSKLDAIAKERDAVAKERDRIKVQLAKLRNGLGGSTALVTGALVTGTNKGGHGASDEPPWAAGGDLAAKATKKTG